MNTDDYVEFFNDMEMIKEKINANEFEINNFPIELNKVLDEKIEIEKNQYNKILNQKETLIKNKEGIQSQERLLNKEKIEVTSAIKSFEDKIKSLDENKVNELKKNKIKIQSDMD
jgi:DNA mismatch repair ATPase MutS